MSDTTSELEVHEQSGDPAMRYYATDGSIGAASWSPEAALARVRKMRRDLSRWYGGSGA